MFVLRMEHDSQRIAHIVQQAPAWVRLGIAAPDARCRQRAVEELGAIVADRLASPEAVNDPRQMPLL